MLNVKGEGRVRVLNVPIDNISEKSFGTVVEKLAESNSKAQIVLLDFAGFLRAQHSKKYRTCLEAAALVVPISGSITGGASFLGKGSIQRYFSFNFVIRLLGALEKEHKSIYLLGSRKHVVQVSEANIRTSFPGLRIVGRYAGNFPLDMEKNVLLAIKKAAPTILLIGKGLKGNDLWINNNKGMLPKGMYLWCKDSFEVFSGKRKKLPQQKGRRLMHYLLDVLKNPWKILKVFLYVYYGFLLLAYKILRR